MKYLIQVASLASSFTLVNVCFSMFTVHVCQALFIVIDLMCAISSEHFYLMKISLNNCMYRLNENVGTSLFVKD